MEGTLASRWGPELPVLLWLAALDDMCEFDDKGIGLSCSYRSASKNLIPKPHLPDGASVLGVTLTHSI